MKSILYTPENVKACIELRKDVTRRLAGLKEINQDPDKWNLYADTPDQLGMWWFELTDKQKLVTVKPRCHVGEIVYVKEVHYAYGMWEKRRNLPGQNFVQCDDFGIWFPDHKPAILNLLHGHNDVGWYKRSPLFLPEKDARYFQQIVSVRAERLQEITEEDAQREGVERLKLSPDTIPNMTPPFNRVHPLTSSYVMAFSALWGSINVKPGTRWADNPWVWRKEVKMVLRPNKGVTEND